MNKNLRFYNKINHHSNNKLVIQVAINSQKNKWKINIQKDLKIS